MEKNSMVFYRSFYEAIRELPRDVQGEIYTAIMEYGLNGNETEHLKPIARSIFMLVKPQIDANNQRFTNGCKGGRPRGTTTKQSADNNQTKTDQVPNVNENVNDKKENIKRKVGEVFTPPTIGQMEEYFQSKGYDAATARRAYEYYSAGEWTDRNGAPIRNWKQKCIANWFKTEGRTEHNEAPKPLKLLG